VLGNPCLVSCVASETECATINPHTAGINPSEDPQLCSTCDITACRFCTFEQGAATCHSCFDGFELIEHADGTQECIVFGQTAIVYIAYILMTVILAAVLLVLAGTCYVAAAQHMKRTWSSPAPDLTAGLLTGTSAGVPVSSDDVEPAKAKSHNEKAIAHGLMTSLEASIKFNALRRAASRSGQKDLKRIIEATLDTADDLGVGLQLFYNTQIFLIAFSLLGFGVAYFFLRILTPGATLTELMEEAAVCPTSLQQLRSFEEQVISRETLRAERGQVMGIVLWFCGVWLSWGFHYYQKVYMRKYDAQHQTSDDYTLMLEDVPREVTSERALQERLEAELSIQGGIYGVCILYDLLHVPAEIRERIEAMLEHIIEWDDMCNGWAKQDFSVSKQQLKLELEKDAADFQNILREHLRCCGRAYIIFSTQVSMIRILRERRGIRKNVLAPSAGTDADAKEIRMAGIRWRGDQPDGLRFWKAEETPAERRITLSVLPARQFAYILVYIIVAQLFFYFMQKPWHDSSLEGASGAKGVQLAGKGVLLVNFAIQTAVAFDVDEAKIIRISKVDEITFLWNTLLMAITLLYVLIQECDKAGMSPTFLLPSEAYSEDWWLWRRGLFRSVLAEIQAYDSLLSVFTEQTIMLYVLGEVGNVIGPVAFFWLALRAVFIQNIGGSPKARIQQLLRKMLPKTRSTMMLTAREAEKAQSLVPLLLWMEYTYVVIFPGIALTACYFIDYSMRIWLAQLAFSILFFLWQRYVMLWLYGKSEFDSDGTYFSFIVVWGLVLSMAASSFAFWAYRLDQITERPFAVLIFVLIFMLTYFVYVAGILSIEYHFRKMGKTLDDENVSGNDPGYMAIMEKSGVSWWNTNPIYVLKHRLCPDLAGFEVHEESRNCWPLWSDEGFFEKGKEFRHRQSAGDQRLDSGD